MPDYLDDTPYEEGLFGGKLITAREGFLVGKDNYVALQNMRYSQGGVGLETRSGMRRFNNTAVASGGDIETLWQHTYTFEQSFYQDVYAVSDEKALYKFDSIPESSAGAGSLGSSLFSFSSGCGIPSFCSVEEHAICNSEKDLIAYQGATPYPIMFLYGTDVGNVTTAAAEDNKTFQIGVDEVTDNDTNTKLTITLDTLANNEALYVGCLQPIDGIAWTLGTNKNATGSATILIQYWNGSAWTTVGTVTDGTEASADTPFSQSGTMSWTQIARDGTTNESVEYPRKINGVVAFWYRITSDVTLDNFDVTKITTTKDWWELDDLSDGKVVVPSGFLWYDDAGAGGTDDAWIDALDKVLIDSKSMYVKFTDATADEDIAAADEIYVGFPYRVMGFQLHFVEEYTNDGSDSTLTVSYWNGTSFTAFAADEINDGTADSTGDKTFAQTGEVRLEDKGKDVKPCTLPNAGIQLPMYWYKLTFSAKLYNDTNDEMRLWKVAGIPAPKRYADVNNYSWIAKFKDRLFLFGHREAPNTADFSAYKNPFALSGFDTSATWPRITFGNKDGVTCAVPFFNEMIVFKRNEVWMLQGDSPDNFGTLLLDDTIGCVAPHTAKLVRTWVTLPDGRTDFRHAVFFQAYDGIYAVDGVKVWKVSEDLDNYWDPTETTTTIKSGYRDLSYSWFDPIEHEYHILIWSGTTPTLTEFAYNTHFQKWCGPNPRLTDIECGLSVVDGNFERMSYGGGTDGRVYRLENGSNDVYTNGTEGAIDCYVETGDQWSGLLSMYAHRGVFLFGKAQSAGSVTVGLKGDGATNATTLGTISMVRAGYSTFIGKVGIGDADSGGTAMENKFHSTRLKFATNTAGVRQELFGYLVKKKDVSEAATGI
jgi:hypothetical protein